MVNNQPNAVVTVGDLGTGFSRASDGKIVVQIEPDLTLAYESGPDVFSGKFQIKDASSGNVLTEIYATNLYDATGEYIGTVMNFGLAALT